jgi:hypothetical protein
MWAVTREQSALVQAPAPPKSCLNALELAALHSPKQARNQELWSLVGLAQALGGGAGSAPICLQERGALAYQVCTPSLSPAGPGQLLKVGPLERCKRLTRRLLRRSTFKPAPCS